MAEKGSLMLLKEGLIIDPAVTIAGARTTSYRTNNEMVEITDKDASQKRQLLEGAGTQSHQFQLSGVYIDGAIHDTINGYVQADSFNNFSMVFANGDTIEGSFQITEYENTGEYNGEQTFSMTLESTAALTFTPSP